MTEYAQRQLLIELRSILLMAVDKIERYLQIGKYLPRAVDAGASATVTWNPPPAVETMTAVEVDKKESVPSGNEHDV